MKAKRRVLVAVGAALTLFAIGSGLRAAQAQSSTAPKFGSYTLAATAPGFEMTEDRTLAQAHPEGGFQAPFTSAVLKAPNQGYAVASVAWPGATGANIDKVVALLFPKDVPVGPPGDKPLTSVHIPDALRALAVGNSDFASYPIRAEAGTGTGVSDNSFDAKGAALTAHADPALAQSTASMRGAEAPDTFSFGSSNGVSNATLSSTSGVATATSKVSNIDFGGVIKIDSVTSMATATTNGTVASASGLTVVEGMTIAGQPAYVDDQGVHIGKEGDPSAVNAVASEIANQALNGAGFSFAVAQPIAPTPTGGNASYIAGTLYITQHFSQSTDAPFFVFALGGSRVSVGASPAFTYQPPAFTPPTSGIVLAGSPGSPGRPGISSTPNTAQTAAPAGTAAPPTNRGVSIAATFDGLAGPLVVGLLGSGMMFFGTKRLADDILDRPPSTCPLENT